MTNNGLNIKDLENLSGIKAHTIRMWEKRYNILEPKRTKTNIRYYDNQDLIKLLNITSILDNGMRISKVSTLTIEEINQQVLEIKSENIDGAKKIIINELLGATLKCDAISFETTFISYRAQHGFEATIEDILYPLLIRIGLMWTVSKLNPSQEHFASQLIKQKLFSAINELPLVATQRKFLLYLPEKEDHEIGLLYAYYLIKKAGYQTIYLGPNVPLVDVIECAKNSEATEILCSFTIPHSEDKITRYIDKMLNKLSFSNVLLHNAKLQDKKGDYASKAVFLNSLEDLRNLL